MHPEPNDQLLTAIDDEAAFQMLVKSSQDTNVKLVAVAAWLTASITHTPDP